MSDAPGDDAVTDAESSATENAADAEPDLPGEDNAGERLIEKYDPTIDSNPEEDLAPDPEDADVSPETARLFWYLVTVFNFAVLGVAVGLMLIGFQDRWVLGGQLTLAGLVLGIYGYYRYRKHAASGDGTDGEDAGTDGNG